MLIDDILLSQCLKEQQSLKTADYYIIECFSKEEATGLLTVLKTLGYKWDNLEPINPDITYYNNRGYGSECYFCNTERKRLLHSDPEWTHKYYSNCEIVPFENFIVGGNREYTKEEEPQAHETTPNTNTKNNENKESKTMNNFFGMNMEFGPSTDENIASTLIGIAVKNEDSWRIYDKEKGILTDVGDMALGSLPLFLVPTTKLKVGDLIRNNGQYYYIVETSNTATKMLSAESGAITTNVPVTNILGMRFYTKVITIADDLFGDCGLTDNKTLALMALMGGNAYSDGNNSANAILPLMLLKKKFSHKRDDTSYNALEDEAAFDEDMMKLMMVVSALSSLPSNGNDGSNASTNANNGLCDMMKMLPMMMLLRDEELF